MSARKTQYRTPSGFIITTELYNELGRSVKNYNSRLGRASKKYSNDLRTYMPNKLKLSHIRDLIKSEQDVTRVIDMLDVYRGEGLELVANPYNQGYITQGQLINAQAMSEAENLRRQQAIDFATKDAQSAGRLPTDRDAMLMETTPKDFIGDSPIASIMNGRTIDERAVNWQNNYVKKLDQTIKIILLSGRVDSQRFLELDELSREIEKIVLNLTPTQFYHAQLIFTELDIKIISDVSEVANALEEVLQKWQEFTHEYA